MSNQNFIQISKPFFFFPEFHSGQIQWSGVRKKYKWFIIAFNQTDCFISSISSSLPSLYRRRRSSSIYIYIYMHTLDRYIWYESKKRAIYLLTSSPSSSSSAAAAAKAMATATSATQCLQLSLYFSHRNRCCCCCCQCYCCCCFWFDGRFFFVHFVSEQEIMCDRMCICMCMRVDVQRCSWDKQCENAIDPLNRFWKIVRRAFGKEFVVGVNEK